MAFSVPRHNASQDGYHRYLEDSEKERSLQVTRIERKSSYIDFALQNLKLEVNMRLAIDSDALDIHTWDAWTTYMQVAEALFAVSTVSPGSSVERVIDRKVRTLKAVEPGPSAGAENWLTAFFLSVTCRDDTRSRFLCSIPVEFIQESGESQGNSYDSYIYPWISAIQDLVLRRRSLGDNLLSAMELSEPDNIVLHSAEYANHVVFPQINSLYRLSQYDTDEFNQALHQGLLLFRDYYTRDEDRSKSLEGVIPLGLVAIACLSRDASMVHPGFDFTIQSEYLPSGLLNEIWKNSYPI